MNKTIVIILLSVATSLLTACSNKPIYLDFRSIPSDTWHQDSVLDFTFMVDDTLSTYDILFHVRHTDGYRYQNMWLFTTFSDSLYQHTDTLEFYLADDRGRWLGNGRNGLIEMPILYEQNYRFAHRGTWHIRMQQGMRDSALAGVHDAGVEIVAYGQE